MNKKGSIFDIFLVLALLLVIMLFFAGWIYGHNLLTERLIEVALVSDTEMVNITEATQGTFSQVNNALPALRWVAFVIVIAMVISIMVSSFLVKANPVFFILYILIVVVAIIFSAYLSNAYETILLDSANVLAPELQRFTGMNFIMNNLPIWTTIIGFAGAIFLFIGIIIDRNAGGSLPV